MIVWGAEAWIDRYFTATDLDTEFEQPQASFTVSVTVEVVALANLYDGLWLVEVPHFFLESQKVQAHEAGLPDVVVPVDWTL